MKLTLFNLKNLILTIFEDWSAYVNLDNLMSELCSMTTNLDNNLFGNDKDYYLIFLYFILKNFAID